MIFAFDLDNTICEAKTGNKTYADVLPHPEAIAIMQALKMNGHTIIILTGRHMKTCKNNEGLVLGKQGKILFDWLERWNIPYDEIHFKPHYDLCIDDATHQHVDWETTRQAIYNRITSGERTPENP